MGEKPPDPEPRARRRRRRRLRRATGCLLLLTGTVGILIWITLPDTDRLTVGWPERTAFMRAWIDGGGDADEMRYRPVALDRIPTSVRRAVLVSEDAAFYEHRGFDWHEIRAAVGEAWEERAFPRGASTITQQLARNLYLSPSRTPLRKLREALIARRLERSLSKDRILELYLNVAEFGPGVYGVEAAARHYWGVPASGLTRRQAAELAATLPSPRRANPATRPRDFLRRAELAHARAFGNRARGEADVTPPAPAVTDSALAPSDTSETPASEATREGAANTTTDAADTTTRTADTTTRTADTVSVGAAADTLAGADRAPGARQPPDRRSTHRRRR